MIQEPTDHTSKTVARMVGEVRLKLPPMFRAELDQAVDNGLAKLPPKTRAELKDLIAGQVALTLRASNFNEVIEDEFSRLRAAEEVAAEAARFQRRAHFQNMHRDVCEPFQAAIFRRSSYRDVEQAFNNLLFRAGLCDDEDAEAIKEWAHNLMGKYEKLIGLRKD